MHRVEQITPGDHTGKLHPVVYKIQCFNGLPVIIPAKSFQGLHESVIPVLKRGNSCQVISLDNITRPTTTG